MPENILIESINNLNNKLEESKSTDESKLSGLGDFTREELLYLNKKPKIEYLRKDRTASQPRAPRCNYFKRKNSEQTEHRSKQERIIKEFTEEDFRVIVQAAKTRIGTNIVKKVYNQITHLSQLRTEPMCNYKAEDL